MVRFLREERLGYCTAEEFQPPLGAGREGRGVADRASFVLVMPLREGRAHEVVPFRRVLFEAVNPSRWHGPDGATELPPHWIRPGPAGSDEVVLELDSDVELAAPLWRVTELAVSRRATPPRLGMFHSFELPGGRVPSPARWIELGRSAGLDLVWGDRRGEPVPAFRVPAATSEAHCLYFRSPPNLRYPPDLWIRNAEDGAFWVSDGLHEHPEAWRPLLDALCREESPVVHSGNCAFTAAEWLEHLRTKELTLPPEPASPESIAIVVPLRRS